MTTDEVLFERKGAAGIITLNRPKALNAVTSVMVAAMTRQLLDWARDEAVSRVIIKAASGRAFSAGGDVVQLYHWGQAKDPQFIDFYRGEYMLDTLIKDYPKPIVALVDGIVMGGGVGVSFNASHCVIGDNALFAMPETGIGLFPDVGGTWFLPRCVGATGMYLGLTGARLKAGDTLYAGLVRAYVPSVRFDELEVALADGGNVDAAIDGSAGEVEPGNLAAHRAEIDAHFGKPDLREVLGSLEAGDTAFCKRTAKELATKSPTSLRLTHRQLREGASLDFHAAMQLEFRLVNRILHHHDFFEGIRAVVLDKTGDAKWQPATLDAVADAVIDEFFAPVDAPLVFHKI